MTKILKPHDKSIVDMLSSRIEVLQFGKGHFSDTELITCIIEQVIVTSSALVFFVRREITETKTEHHFVLKILQGLRDPRYNWETLKKRQDSQKEALKWNGIFSPGLNLKLSNICNIDLSSNTLQISNSDHTRLDTKMDYGLVMPRLPDDKHLNFLLHEQNEESLYKIVHLVTKRLIQIHADLSALPAEEGQKWGRLEPLQEKLEHNLELADPILNGSYSTKLENLVELQSIFIHVRENLRLALVKYPYHRYFEQRLEEQRIKRCHGDLKCSNIWVDSNQVLILDAIDFSPMYSNIDTLSDFATFIIDVEAHISSFKHKKLILNQIQNFYLLATNQHTNQAAKAVLNYYLVEKAFISAAISFIHDEAPNLGLKYLEIAKERLELLMAS